MSENDIRAENAYQDMQAERSYEQLQRERQAVETKVKRFRKRPIVIEAFQMTEVRRTDNSDWPNWLHEAWNKEGEGALFIGGDDPSRQRLVLGTLEGVHRVQWNDWIIRGIKGELYACKPDIFEATYEEVEEGGRDDR